MSNMHLEQGSRVRTRRASAGVACGTRAMLGLPRPIYNIWRQLRL